MSKDTSQTVDIFVKTEFLKVYKISILDDNKHDILWLKFLSERQTENIVLCVCYLPPSESTRLNDPELFYATLLEHLCSYQNKGRLIVCGDFNFRVEDAAEYIEGVDDVIIRNVKDYTSNVNGDLFIEFVVDCGMCIVNGRVCQDDFTHGSQRGKSVVEDVSVPINSCLLSDLADMLKCRSVTKIPDHSVLT